MPVAVAQVLLEVQDTFLFLAVKVSPKRSIFIKTNGIVFET